MISLLESDSTAIDTASARLSQRRSNTGAVVCAGDIISTDTQDGFLRGHGTQADSDELRATLCGVVQRVNKLVTVKALHQRYVAELGDLVVGRIVEIVGKRWKLDLHSYQDASLQLSAVHLPGGVQRRRTVEDELNMRGVYQEGDLISAEIQQLHGDNSVSLHTRSAKYGKLKTGQLVIVPANLVPRQKKHFCSLPEVGVDLILGVNGMIWVTCGGYLEAKEEDRKEPSREQLESVVRAANAIRALAKLKFPVTASRVSMLVQASKNGQTPPGSMLDQKSLLSIIEREVNFREKDEEE